LRPSHQGREASEPIAREFRWAAIRIEEPHCRTTRTQFVEDEPVGPDTLMSIAQPPSQLGEIVGATRGSCGQRSDEQKVVAVGVGLDERNAHQGTWKALNTM
jgi:hypothetical protein